MVYCTDYCFTSQEIFENFNFKTLKVGKEICEKKYAAHSRKALCGKILAYCLYLIILDIIENNITFVLPLTNGLKASFYVKSVNGDRFQHAYSQGKFQGIDFLSSNFTGYQICFRYQLRGHTMAEKDVYINEKLKLRFYELINSGKVYY